MICDSIHYFEQPRWWDDINVLIDDSIMKVSKSANEYLQLCRAHRKEKLYNDSIYKESYDQYRKYPLKAKYLYNKIRKNSNSSLLHSFSKEVSHGLSIEINEQLFHCDKEYHNSSIAEYIGDDYFAICNYDKAISYYNLVLQLNKNEKDVEKDSTKLRYYDNKKKWVARKLTDIDEKLKGSRRDVATCNFRDEINTILETINDYKTPKRKEQIKAFIENRREKEILSDILDENTDYFYTSKTDYELALCNILYEDAKSKNPLIINSKTITSVEENFKDFNMLDHTNFKVGISDIGTLNEDKDEWLISFWSDIEDSHGITVIYLKGYEITDIHSVD
ncbi:hypothetical protein [Aquimarina aquimarini]|uniref:hypothetical protein n=1 Tax=Aquimarina aquimarini TaxID=1191734 RepID=UPI00131F0D6D|nr:hypothetical protein [Aquimarina aquimarini]